MHYWFYELKFSRFHDILYAVMHPKQTNKKSSLRFLVVFSIWHWRMLVREAKKVLPRCPTHPCHCEPSQMAWQSLFCCCVARALMRPVRILVFVQTELALVFTYSDSLREKRSNPVNYARTRMRATLLFTGSPRSQMLPRDDKNGYLLNPR